MEKIRYKTSLIVPFLLAFILWGCIGSPKARKRKAARKMEKARFLDPERFKRDTVVILDTIYFIDTVIVDRVTHDTVTRLVVRDSVTVINNETIKVKYYYDDHTGEIRHEIEEKAREIIIEKEIIREVEVVVEKIIWPTKWDMFKAYGPYLGILLFIIALLIIAKKSLG